VDSISAALVRVRSHHPPAGTIYHPRTTWPILRTSHAKSQPVGQWTLTILRTLAMTADGQVWQPLKVVASKVMKALGGGWALKTKCGHTGAIDRYLGFCKEERVPQDLWLLAQEQVIVAFAASWAGTISGLTVCQDIAGPHAWHTQHNLAWPGLRAAGCASSLRVSGVCTPSPPGKRSGPRLPWTCCGGFSMAWTSSTTLTKQSDCACWLHFGSSAGSASCSQEAVLAFLTTFYPLHDDWHNGKAAPIHLPWTKTTCLQGAMVHILRQASRMCPLTSLRSLLALGHVPSNVHLFGFLDQSGHRQALSKQIFIARVNEVWAADGIPWITGHSLRIGGTTGVTQGNQTPLDPKQLVMLVDQG
jgi:hypothetical protein